MSATRLATSVATGQDVSMRLAVGLVAAASVLLAAADTWAATTLDPSPNTATFEATTAIATVTVDIEINNVADLTGWQFHIHNPDPDPGTQPRITSVTAGGWWQAGNEVFATQSHDWGEVVLGYEYPTVVGKTGSGAVARVTISYGGAAPGNYTFTIDHEELVDTGYNVISTTVTSFTLVVEGSQAPQPDPPILAVTGKTISSIALQCSECTDRTAPVNYQFNKGEPSPGTTLRDWNVSRSAEDTNLPANSRHTYRARAKDSTAEENTTGWSADVSCYTLPMPPIASCDRGSPGQYLVDTVFTFTNDVGWGEGALDHYHYAWKKGATHTFTGAEAEWSAASLPLIADSSGNWYLHVMSHNPDHESGGTLALGPYNVGDLPAAPTNFAHSANTLDSITWSWLDTSDNETGFRIDPPGHTVSADVMSWTETGLSVNTAYTRHVTAYNLFGDSAPSNDHAAYTSIETPTALSFGVVTNTTIGLNADGTLSNLASGNSGVYFNETGGTATGIDQWVQAASDTATGLTPNTQYAFRAMARNGDGDETPHSPTSQKYSLASQPGAEPLTNVAADSVQANWNAGTPANPAGTLYLVECYEGAGFGGPMADDSGWITTLSHTFGGLDPNAQYSFRVRAKNGEDVTTEWTDLGTLYTLPESPGALTLDMEAKAGATLNLTAPACRSLSIISIELSGNPSHTPIAIKVDGGGWLGFVDDGQGHTDVYTDAPAEEWHTAAEWAGKRIRGLAPDTAYVFHAKAKNSADQESALVPVGTYSTNKDGDVDRDGSTTILDLVYVRDAALAGGQIGTDYSWATDVNDDAFRRADTNDMGDVRLIILNP